MHQLKLESPSSSCHTDFSQFTGRVRVFINLFIASSLPTYLSLSLSISLSLSLYLFLSFLLNRIRSYLVVGIRRSVYIWKSLRISCLFSSWKNSGLCMYHLVVWSKSNLLPKSHWTAFPTQSFFVFHSFCTTLLHSQIMWLIVLSFSPHILHLLLCCILSIFALNNCFYDVLLYCY